MQLYLSAHSIIMTCTSNDSKHGVGFVVSWSLYRNLTIFEDKRPVAFIGFPNNRADTISIIMAYQLFISRVVNRIIKSVEVSDRVACGANVNNVFIGSTLNDM